MTLNGGTLRAQPGSVTYMTNDLYMTGGGFDFTGAVGFGFYVLSGRINIDSGTTTWIGSEGSRVNGSLTAPMTISIFDGGTLNAGIPLDTRGNPLIKTGFGTLILSNAFNQTTGITVDSGIVETDSDGRLGPADVTVNPLGTLRYTGSTTTNTLRNYILNGGTLEVANGATLTLNQATIVGGFPASNGTGKFSVGQFGALVNGSTMFGGTTFEVAGPTTFANVTTGAAVTVNSGQTLTLNRGRQTAAGVMTVNGAVNAPFGYESIGRIAVPGGTPGGSFNVGTGGLVLGGGSVTTIGNYNPANGQVIPGGTLNIGPGDMRVQGGFVRNNGVITGMGNLIIDFGAVVRGAGEIDLPNAPIRINGGQLLAGNSPGLTRVTNFSLVSTGVTGGDFSNATGIAGPPIGSTGTQLSGFSVFEYGNAANTGGSAQVQGTPASKAIWQFRTVIDGGDYSTSGVPANFDAAQSYVWGIVRPRSNADVGNPTNITPINTVAQITIFDTATMTNVALNNANLNAYLRFDDSLWNWGTVPVNERGSFAFVLMPDGLGALDRVIGLAYTPVPEPVWILSACMAGFSGWAAWRRRQTSRAVSA
jgi:hypothetical protein